MEGTWKALGSHKTHARLSFFSQFWGVGSHGRRGSHFSFQNRNERKDIAMSTQISNSLQAFKSMIRRGEFVVLDTETTGLERGEIVQIAVIDASGAVLLDTLVKPVNPIPPDASRIHGLYAADVADAPTWEAVSAQLVPLLTGRNVVIY